MYTRLSIGGTTPGHHSPACCSPLPRLWSAVTELFKWQRGLLDNKWRQREIRGKRAAMITGSLAWEADNPERHHLAVWKQREVGLRWQKAAHYAWFQSALLHVWIAGCNYAIRLHNTRQNLCKSSLINLEIHADEVKKMCCIKHQVHIYIYIVVTGPMSRNVLYIYYVWTGSESID